MRFEKFTLKVQEALNTAQQLAAQYGQQGLDVEHLLLALLRTPGGIAGSIVSKLGADPGQIDAEIERSLQRGPKVQGQGASQLYITPRLKQVLDNAVSEAAHLTDEYVSAEHILIAMADEKQG